MPIELPSRHYGSDRAVRGIKLPTAADVPSVRPAPDPGVRVPKPARSGLEDIGAGLATLGAGLAEAERRIADRDDSVEIARAVSAYNESAAAELRRMQTEEDFSTVGATTKFNAKIRDAAGQHVAGYRGTADGRARLQVRLEGLRSHYADQAAVAGLDAGKKRVTQALDESLNSLSANVYAAPASLAESYASLDGIIDDMAPALRPEDEIDFRERGRQVLAERAAESFLDRGDAEGAKQILAATPGLERILSPAQQTKLTARIATVERAASEAANKGRLRLLEAEQVLGRAPTLQERVRLAGVEPKEGRESPTEKIAGIEAALGRPLDKAERSRALGLGGGEAQSTPGKILSDRQRLIDLYGKDSEQVSAFDDLASKPAEPPSLADIGGQRKEFTKLSGDFVSVRDSFNRVAASASNPSPAGDLSLLFNYMKILDPGSVVRESEFAQAAATGSFGQQLQAAAERFLAGQRLTDEQRADFLSRAEMLMTAQTRTQLQLEAAFRDIARRSSLNPDDVIVDFVGPLRAKFPNAPPAKSGAQAGEPPPKPPVVIEYGIDGKPVTGPR